MDDFDDLQDDDFAFDDDFSSSPGQNDDTDEFAQLRRSSARRETIDSGLSDESVPSTNSSSSSGFSLSNFTAMQRVILALLVVLDILVIGVGLMVVLGAIG